jgi:hypothetical protein
LQSLIDVLASNYHWAKREILDYVYLDEAIEYLDMIKRRKLQDDLMMLAIISNPHTKEPKTLQNYLTGELKKMERRGMIDTTPEVGAFTKLKSILNKR